MPAVIQRLIFDDGGMPSVLFLRRDTALFAEHEWVWTREGDEAVVFPDYAAADSMARALGDGAFPAIRAVRAGVVNTCLPGMALDQTLARMEREHPHEEVYAETERRCG